MPFPTHAFYKAGDTTIQDVAVQRDGAWFGGYGGQPQAALEASGYALMTFDAAFDASSAAQHARYVRGPMPTDRESFDRMLCELPPRGWTHDGDSESFKMSEMTAGLITTIFCRVGERFWELSDLVTTPHAVIVRRCLASL